MFAIPLHQNLQYPERATNEYLNNGFILERAKGYWNALRTRSLAEHQSFADKVTEFSTLLENSNGTVFEAIVIQTRQELRQFGLQSSLAIRAMALVRHAIFLQTGLRAYPTQILAASVMLDNCLAEMQTGEGKSLAIILAAGTAALAGLPVHVITANDYLAERDAEKARSVLRILQISVGSITSELEHEDRGEEYKNEITFCTARELVFDYLRDSVSKKKRTTSLHGLAHSITQSSNNEQQVLRGLSFAIIDEADSILLDEALTPFILSRQGRQIIDIEHYRLALEFAAKLQQNIHFEIVKSKHKVVLNEKGQSELDQLASNEISLWQVHRFRSHIVEQALSAMYLFHKDQDYLIKDDEIVIIDSVTGRIADGRKWSQGIHQFLELKEGLEISEDLEQMVKITYQTFFPRYLKLGGTSGTLREDRNELNRSYQLPVIKIPLRLPCQRKRSSALMFTQQNLKWAEVVSRIQAHHIDSKPVLITVGSVEDAELLSNKLLEYKLEHVTLNARQNATEAEIISHAGETGAITIATNMAGRGTDISLSPEAEQLGGLHVIQCHLNHSRRIDRQVTGRCARNGEPGSVETIIAIDDPLTSRYTPNWLIKVLQTITRREKPLPAFLSDLIIRASQVRAKHVATQQRYRLKQHDKKMSKLLSISGSRT